MFDKINVIEYGKLKIELKNKLNEADEIIKDLYLAKISLAKTIVLARVRSDVSEKTVFSFSNEVNVQKSSLIDELIELNICEKNLLEIFSPILNLLKGEDKIKIDTWADVEGLMKSYQDYINKM